VGASVTLVTPALAVEPGQEVTAEVRVRNTGSVVDEFTLDVLGDAAGWASADPPVLSLFPGAEGNAKLVLRPRRVASTTAGVVPYALRARSREDPAGSAVEEGTITVGAFAAPFTELAPRTSRGSRGGTHDLAVDNRGNARLNAGVEGTDADRQLKFDIKPPGVVVEPGMAGFAKVRVSPVKRFWRGQPKTRAFQLLVTPEGGAPLTVDGTLLQESVLPSWFLKALIALIVVLIALVLIWMLLLKPTLDSAVTDAVASPLASLKADVNDALGAAGLPTIAPEASAGGGGPSTPPAGGSAGPAPSGGAASPEPSGSPSVVIPGLGNPVDGRLDSTNPQFTPAGTLFLTDFVFSNPNGATGTIRVLRGSNELLLLKLDNFRDYDLHFVTPIVILPDQTLKIDCGAAGCADAALFWSGYLRP
jgi:hypothetical protein